MTVLGLGALTWYYANNASRQARPAAASKARRRIRKAKWSCRASADRSPVAADRPLARLTSPQPIDALPVSAADRVALTATTLPEIPLAATRQATAPAQRPRALRSSAGYPARCFRTPAWPGYRAGRNDRLRDLRPGRATAAPPVTLAGLLHAATTPPRTPRYCRHNSCCCPRERSSIALWRRPLIDAAGNDDLRHGDGHIRCRRQGGVDGARHEAGRRDPRPGAARASEGIRAVDRGPNAPA